MRYFLFLLTTLLLAAVPCAANAQMPLRIAMDQWPPYEHHKDGKSTGVSLEATTAVLKSMGVGIRSMETVPWGRGLEMLKGGEIDALVSGVYTPERAKYSYYPKESILTAEWRAFVHCHRSNPAIFDSIEQLYRKRIGIVRNFSYPKEFIDRAKQISFLEPVNLDETNFRKLITGRIDVVISDYLNGLWLLNELGIDSVVCATSVPIGSREIYVLFSKKTVNKELVGRFSEELRRFKSTPAYKELLKKTRR